MMHISFLFQNVPGYIVLQYRPPRSQSHSRAQSRQTTPIKEEEGDIYTARVTTDDYPTMTTPTFNSDTYTPRSGIFKTPRVNSDMYTDANGFTRATPSDTYVDKNGYTRAMPDCFIPGATSTNTENGNLGSKPYRTGSRSYMGR